tara:strand:- start:6764 stop:7711 length:948 start_codon:yes stop_codon:yes gene_type:complete
LNNRKIKIGVIGVGYLGKFHVKHLNNLDLYDLVGIYDINQKQANSFSLKNNVRSFDSMVSLLKSVDAVSIVTPTEFHFPIANEALNHGCHVFIEKPITDVVSDANKILQKSIKRKKIIHVGHIERLNPAFKKYHSISTNPLFIECHRLTKINKRSMDISVVLDLMIHDIDLILMVVKSQVKEIIADGICVISSNIDLANVKLIFENGVVANLTASRISNKDMRKMRVFENKKYSSIDLLNKEVVSYQAIRNESGNLEFHNQNDAVENYDALAAELIHFHTTIVKNDLNTENISNAIEALKIANEINQIISMKLKK